MGFLPECLGSSGLRFGLWGLRFGLSLWESMSLRVGLRGVAVEGFRV